MQTWQTLSVPCMGGVIENQPFEVLSASFPGALLFGQNMEPSLEGGYRRIDGYTKQTSVEVPDYYDDAGTPTENASDPTDVAGVAFWGNFVVAARNDYFYTADPENSASTWTRINSANPIGQPSTVRFVKFTLGTKRIVALQSTAKPVMYDGSTVTALSSAGYNHVVGDYFVGHLFMSDGTDVVEFSAPNNPADYNAANGAGEFKLGDNVVAIRSHRKYLYIFCENSIYRIVGNALANFSLEQVATNIGCMATESVVEVGGVLYFLAPDGIRPISLGDTEGDTQLETVSRPIYNTVQTLIDRGCSWICAVAVRSKNQYRLLQCRAPEEGVLGGIRSSAEGTPVWEWFKTKGIRARHADSGYYNDVEYVVFSNHTGYVYRMENGSSFDGGNIEAVLKTPHHFMGDPTYQKTVHELTLFGLASEGRSIEIATEIDQGNAKIAQPDSFTISIPTPAARYGVDTYGTGIYGVEIVNRLDDYLEGSGHSFSFRFVSNDTDPSWTLRSYNVQWDANGRY